MVKRHTVIVIPGLGDKTGLLQCATYHWRIFDLNTIIYPFGWHDTSVSYEKSFTQLLSLIDERIANGDTVSLIGTSAGASAVINAYSKRKSSIYRVVNICGRLRKGSQKGFRSFASRTRSSSTFAKSVLYAEKNIDKLSTHDRKKILTIRPLFGDELVPADTVLVKSAKNIQIPTIEHVLSIAFAVTLFSQKIISFLQGKNR
jgi:hypothetical protein